MSHGDPLGVEMDRAKQVLRGLAGESVDAIEVKSLSSEEAPFLGQVVSKLSPMIGNLLEARLIQVLDEGAHPDLHWRRQDPDFPDAALFDKLGRALGAGFEVKAWYALSTELTGRFRESQNLLAARDVHVVVIAWVMSHIVYGTPQILDVLIVPAKQVAAARDAHYHRPPDYLILEPGDTSARTRNLQQTNVAGYKWQETTAGKVADAQKLMRGYARKPNAPHSPVEQEMAKALISAFNYRLDTNFAKIDRIDDEDIEAFKSKVLAMTAHGRTMKDWAKLLRDLNSDNAETSARAAKRMQQIYAAL